MVGGKITVLLPGVGFMVDFGWSWWMWMWNLNLVLALALALALVLVLVLALVGWEGEVVWRCVVKVERSPLGLGKCVSVGGEKCQCNLLFW